MTVKLIYLGFGLLIRYKKRFQKVILGSWNLWWAVFIQLFYHFKDQISVRLIEKNNWQLIRQFLGNKSASRKIVTDNSQI